MIGLGCSGGATSLLLISSFAILAFGYHRQAALIPLRSNVDGAVVNLLRDTTINGINSDSWEILSSGSGGSWAIEISLDSSWGFHPFLPSNITLRVNSNTPTETSTAADLDPLFAFSVNRSKYWSTALNADGGITSSWYNNKIGPQCDIATPPRSASLLYTGDVKVIAENSQHREDAVLRGWNNVDEWQPFNDVIYFPLEFKIENIPSLNLMYVYHIQQGYTQKCGFAEAFESDQGLQIYLHLDDPGEFLAVQSFEVEYEHEDETTPNPTTADPTTAHPSTRNPTTPNPSTADPTSNPTLWPTTGNPSTAHPSTNNPTTSDPTSADPTTAAPSKNPTGNPFITTLTTTTASSSSDREVDNRSSDPGTTTDMMTVDNTGGWTWATQNINLLLSIFGAVFVCVLCVICILCYKNVKASSESGQQRKLAENEHVELSPNNNTKIVKNDSVELQLEGGGAPRADARAAAESVIDPNRNYKPEGDRASFITPNGETLQNNLYRKQSESSKTRSSDSSLAMHEDHWAVLKVTNYAGVDEAQKLEIFDRDIGEVGEQNTEHTVNGPTDTKRK